MASSTKIGYVSRDPSEQINWAEVGANFTGMLKEEARVREEKKAEIDSATREMQRVFDETPMGDSKDLNQWALSYGAEAQKQLLMVNTLLKSGQLKPQDYTVIRQNLADGTDQAFTLLDEYNKEYTDKMERMKSNDPTMSSQKLEQWVMGTVEGFGNFSKSKLMINPQTGKVMVGFINPDTGEVESDPNKLVGVNSLRNRIKSKYDKYDMTAAVTKAKQETFGQFQAIERTIGNARAQGLLKTYNDPTMRSEKTIARLVKEGVITAEQGALYATYDKTEDAWLESQLSQYNTTSLLTDNLRQATGKNYDFTFNPAEQSENTILLKQIDGQVVPDFDNEIGKKQREDAKNGLQTVLRGALDHEVKVQTVNDYTPPSYAPQYVTEGREAKKEAINAQKTWNSVYGATPEQMDTYLNTMLGTGIAYSKGIKNIRVTAKGGLEIEYTPDPKTGERVSPKNRIGKNAIKIDFNKMTRQEWARLGNELTGLDDPNEAYNAGGFSGNTWFSNMPENADGKRSFKSASAGGRGGDSAISTSGTPSNELEIKDFVQTKMKQVNFSRSTTSKTAEQITELFKNQKVVAKAVGPYGDIEITVPGSEPFILPKVQSAYSKSGQKATDEAIKLITVRLLKKGVNVKVTQKPSPTTPAAASINTSKYTKKD